MNTSAKNVNPIEKVKRILEAKSLTEKLKAIEMYERGVSLVEIAEDLDISVSVLLTWIKSKDSLTRQPKPVIAQSSKKQSKRHSIEEDAEKIFSNKRQKTSEETDSDTDEDGGRELKDIIDNFVLEEYTHVKALCKVYHWFSQNMLKMSSRSEKYNKNAITECNQEMKDHILFIESTYFRELSQRFSYLENTISDKK